MALTKEQKAKLMEVYKTKAQNASNVVLLVQKGIPVNGVNELRQHMDETGGQMLVVKKRLFLKSAAEAGFSDSDLDKIDGHLTVLFAGEDEYAPLKLVYKTNKQYKKDRAEYGFSYLWGWYDNQWKDAQFVEEMAALPSKEELIGKFLFLLNYPMQSTAAVLDQIKDKISDGSVETTEDKKVEDSATEEAPKADAEKADESKEAKAPEAVEEAPKADAE